MKEEKYSFARLPEEYFGPKEKTMADNLKNIKPPMRLPVENSEGDKVSRYTKASYFREKDKKGH